MFEWSRRRRERGWCVKTFGWITHSALCAREDQSFGRQSHPIWAVVVVVVVAVGKGYVWEGKVCVCAWGGGTKKYGFRVEMSWPTLSRATLDIWYQRFRITHRQTFNVGQFLWSALTLSTRVCGHPVYIPQYMWVRILKFSSLP